MRRRERVKPNGYFRPTECPPRSDGHREHRVSSRGVHGAVDADAHAVRTVALKRVWDVRKLMNHLVIDTLPRAAAVERLVDPAAVSGCVDDRIADGIAGENLNHMSIRRSTNNPVTAPRGIRDGC